MKEIFTNKKIFDSTLANLLGLQIFRVVLSKVIISFRRFLSHAERDPVVNALIQDGYYAIENFLPEEDFKKVREEFDECMQEDARDATSPPDQFNIAYKTFQFSEKEQEKYPATLKLLLKNRRLLNIFKEHEGRTDKNFLMKGRFKYRFEKVFLDKTRKPVDDKSSNSNMHIDTFHTITKGFYYLNNVNKDNAAFIYVPRSHRLSLKRLAYDYLNSIREKSGGPRVSDEQLKKMRFEKKSLEFPANTLLIADVGYGFHGRGLFKNANTSREIVYIEYRSHPFM